MVRLWCPNDKEELGINGSQKEILAPIFIFRQKMRKRTEMTRIPRENLRERPALNERNGVKG